MAKIALTSNSCQISFQGISSRTRRVVINDYGDDADREKWLIRFWKGPHDWTQDNSDAQCVVGIFQGL
jgi:hypothetical protein